MIRKFFKLLFFGIIATIALAFISYYGFLAWEYKSGGKYVDYITKNQELVSLEEEFSFEIMAEDLQNNDLILTGEIHGFEEPNHFDISFFKHLHKNYGVRDYIAELDILQASLINEYFQTGEDSLLHTALKKWIVVQGRNNKSYYKKYHSFHEFYQKLPESEKFKFIGIDRIQDWSLLMTYINKRSHNYEHLKPLEYHPKTLIAQLEERIAQLIQLESKGEIPLEYLLQNIRYKKNKLYRSDIMFQNFEQLYKHHRLESKKIYGWFGLAHVFQYKINGKDPFASLVRLSDLPLANKIISINFLFVDSYMVMDNTHIPKFLKDRKNLSKFPVSADNIWLMYTYGIGDFKRCTRENSKSIIKMNGEQNPYAHSSRLRKHFQILSLVDLFELNEKDEAYIQYTVFVRNSDWAEPMD